MASEALTILIANAVKAAINTVAFFLEASVICSGAAGATSLIPHRRLLGRGRLAQPLLPQKAAWATLLLL